jgi:hypothetical protein
MSVARTNYSLYRWMVAWVITDELDGMWKEAVVAIFEAFSRNKPGGTEGTKRNVLG